MKVEEYVDLIFRNTILLKQIRIIHEWNDKVNRISNNLNLMFSRKLYR